MSTTKTLKVIGVNQPFILSVVIPNRAKLKAEMALDNAGEKYTQKAYMHAPFYTEFLIEVKNIKDAAVIINYLP